MNEHGDTSSCCCCFVEVRQASIGLKERFGQFTDTLPPGLHCLVPCIDSVRGSVSTRTQQLKVRVETKTRDNVFCNIAISVQYMVREENARLAYYSLSSPQQQISSFVENTVRSRVAEIELDQLFVSKDEIAHAVMDSIDERMRGYGFDIMESLITDIDPEQSVKRAMNAIVEAKRLQEAAEHRGEAEKIKKIKDAEARKAATILDAQADAESKRLQGEGIAKQREAIIGGLKESVSSFASGVGVDSKEAMAYVVLTQHYDSLKDIAARTQTATLFTPYGPGAMQSLSAEISSSFIQAGQATAGLQGAGLGPKRNIMLPGQFEESKGQ